MKDLRRMLPCWRYVRSFVPTDELLQSGLLPVCYKRITADQAETRYTMCCCFCTLDMSRTVRRSRSTLWHITAGDWCLATAWPERRAGMARCYYYYCYYKPSCRDGSAWACWRGLMGARCACKRSLHSQARKLLAVLTGCSLRSPRCSIFSCQTGLSNFYNIDRLTTTKPQAYFKMLP